MKIVVDAMGGDNAPLAPVLGGILAVREYGEEVILVGNEEQIKKIIMEQNAHDLKGLKIVNTTQTVDMCDDPATVLRQKPDSSMAVALKMVKDKKADAIVSAGSTGALLSGATLFCKRIKGIRRGALAPIMPCANGQVMLVDAGANTECTAEYLLQFAFLGSLYAQKINGIEKPRVGLVNNGSEASKGDAIRKETYELLKKAHENGRINFVGNVEGTDVPAGKCDIAVCDGFSGNIMLKTIEGVAKFMGAEIKKIFTKNVATKFGYLLCKNGLDEFKEMFNQDVIGGAPFLGIAHPVIKAHGSSNEIAFMNAIRQAIAYTKSKMIETVEENIEYMIVKEN